MNTLLNLDEYNKNTELTLGGIVYSIPPITYKLKNQLMELFDSIVKSEDESTKRNADLSLIQAYLNTNLGNFVFELDQLEETINAYQARALTEFILDQIRGIEKN